MPNPGWYPDPDRTPGRFRYWTGTAWTEQTTFDPPAGPHTYPATDPSATDRRPAHGARRTRRGAVIVVAAVLAVLLVVVAAVWLVDRQRAAAIREDPATLPSSTVSGWDDSSPTATPDQSATPDPVPTARPRACDQYVAGGATEQPADGRVHGGPLSFARLPEDWQGPDPTSRLPLSRAAVYQHQTLPEKMPWEASAYVGVSTIPPSTDGETATTQLLQCIVTSDFYVSVTVTVTENSARKITVSGKPAVQRDALLRFRHAQLKTTGSRIRIIVVDSAPRTVYFHAVPMERGDLIKELDAATRSLRLD